VNLTEDDRASLLAQARDLARHGSRMAWMLCQMADAAAWRTGPPPRDAHTWIQTHTGKQVWPLNPRVADICIEDIAHALSNLCRFAGHTRDFYSVAQHSVLACNNCATAPLWALLHDAAEAYLCDVPRPVKGYLGGYKEAEVRLERIIAEKFGLPWPMPAEVKEIDLKLLATERRDLMNTPPIQWVSTRDVEPLAALVVPWPADVAEKLFLLRFRELTGGPRP
jgi:uncharacterized protein